MGGRGGVAKKVGMKGCRGNVVPGIENERGSKKRERGEMRREEKDPEGETERAINKVNMRQLRDK